MGRRILSRTNAPGPAVGHTTKIVRPMAESRYVTSSAKSRTLHLFQHPEKNNRQCGTPKLGKNPFRKYSNLGILVQTPKYEKIRKPLNLLKS